MRIIFIRIYVIFVNVSLYTQFVKIFESSEDILLFVKRK
jgi:hypothetical protein